MKNFQDYFAFRIIVESVGDVYSFLGISPNATDEEIEKAFRSLAKKYHPDAGGKTEDFIKLKYAKDEAIKRFWLAILGLDQDTNLKKLLNYELTKAFNERHQSLSQNKASQEEFDRLNKAYGFIRSRIPQPPPGNQQQPPPGNQQQPPPGNQQQPPPGNQQQPPPGNQQQPPPGNQQQPPPGNNPPGGKKKKRKRQPSDDQYAINLAQWFKSNPREELAFINKVYKVYMSKVYSARDADKYKERYEILNNSKYGIQLLSDLHDKHFKGKNIPNDIFEVVYNLALRKLKINLNTMNKRRRYDNSLWSDIQSEVEDSCKDAKTWREKYDCFVNVKNKILGYINPDITLGRLPFSGTQRYEPPESRI